VPQHRDVSELNADQLREIVSEIRQILWFDVDKNEWDPDREWSMDTIEAISGVLDEYGLQPASTEGGNAA
jgi:hypothetical protein